MKKLIFTLLALVAVAAPVVGHAGSLTDTNAAEFGLNQGSQNMLQKYQVGTALQKNRIHSLKGTYDRSKVAGTAATYNLKMANGQNLVLPNKAIVRDCIIDVLTTITVAGSPTIAISTGQAAGDLKATTLYSNYSGLVACLPVGTAATAIKMTADRSPTLVVASGTLSAGKLNVLIEYELSE